MKPLDSYIELANKKYTKYIPIHDTEFQTFKLDGVLFREQDKNNYCYIDLKRDSEKIVLSFFKCDSSFFSEIELSYLSTAISFEICNQVVAKVIFDALL